MDGKVERDVVRLRDAVVGGERRPRFGRVEVAPERAAGHDDALGLARRTGGEDDVGGLPFPAPCGLRQWLGIDFSKAHGALHGLGVVGEEDRSRRVGEYVGIESLRAVAVRHERVELQLAHQPD